MPAPTITTWYEESWMVVEGISSLINEGEGPNEGTTIRGICTLAYATLKKIVSFSYFPFSYETIRRVDASLRSRRVPHIDSCTLPSVSTLFIKSVCEYESDSATTLVSPQLFHPCQTKRPFTCTAHSTPNPGKRGRRDPDFQIAPQTNSPRLIVDSCCEWIRP